MQSLTANETRQSLFMEIYANLCSLHSYFCGNACKMKKKRGISSAPSSPTDQTPAVVMSQNSKTENVHQHQRNIFNVNSNRIIAV